MVKGNGDRIGLVGEERNKMYIVFTAIIVVNRGLEIWQ